VHTGRSGGGPDQARGKSEKASCVDPAEAHLKVSKKTGNSHRSSATSSGNHRKGKLGNRTQLEVWGSVPRSCVSIKEDPLMDEERQGGKGSGKR